MVVNSRWNGTLGCCRKGSFENFCVEPISPNFRRWRLMCPNASRPFFREIPVQKAGGFLPEFTTTERGRSPLEWFLRLVDDPKTETVLTSRMRHGAQGLDTTAHVPC